MTLPSKQLPKQNRATHVVIDRAAYHHNLARVRELVPNAKVMAVIKADGYGHDMEVAAEALSGADEFAISSLDDVYRLRAAGITKPLTVLSAQFDTEQLSRFAELGVRPVLYDLSQLSLFDGLDETAALDVWLKVDTGMGRLGLSPEDVGLIVTRLAKLPGVKSLSLMTHLANADTPTHPNNQAQIKLFEQLATAHLFKELSVLNSAGVVAFQPHAGDYVRPGIMLYGVSPQGGTSAQDLGLRPVMTFKSQLISVKRLPGGSPIGYGSSYTLDSDSKIGVIACGYGDGYPRHAPSGTPVLVNGYLVPLIGRVSMDMITVDLADIPAEVGDEVVLWGEDNPVENVAEAAGTIAYELTCGILPRVERVII